MEQGIISSSGAKPPPAPCFQSIVKPLLSAENMPLLYYIAYECIRGVDAFEADLLKNALFLTLCNHAFKSVIFGWSNYCFFW